MNEPRKEADLLALTKAIRFAFAALVVGISYPNIRFALYLPQFEGVFHDMLGDKQLPLVADFVIHAQSLLIGISILIPLIAVILLFTSGIARSLYIFGVLLIVVFVQLYTTWHAVMAPLVTIIANRPAQT